MASIRPDAKNVKYFIIIISRRLSIKLFVFCCFVEYCNQQEAKKKLAIIAPDAQTALTS